MGFFDHLEELRARSTRCLFVFLIMFVIMFYQTNEYVFDFIRMPLVKAIGPEFSKLNIISPFEHFLTKLKIGAVSSVFVCFPYFMYHVWAFVAPGLYAKGRKLIFPFLLAATLCFLAGAGFAYYVVFPMAFKFLIVVDDNVQPMLSFGDYYSTCLKLFLLFGLTFELPVFIVFMGLLGVVDAPFLRKHRGNAIIGITIVCAMFAPPDAISMILLMMPLIVLYEISILVVAGFGAKKVD